MPPLPSSIARGSVTARVLAVDDAVGAEPANLEVTFTPQQRRMIVADPGGPISLTLEDAVCTLDSAGCLEVTLLAGEYHVSFAGRRFRSFPLTVRDGETVDLTGRITA